MSSSYSKKKSREQVKAMTNADLLELRMVISKEIQVLVQEKARATAMVNRINKELEDRKHNKTEAAVITDHAIVRYLERVEGVNIESVRQKVLDMVNRSVRRDDKFLQDPKTGMVIVKNIDSISVATIIDENEVNKKPATGTGFFTT